MDARNRWRLGALVVGPTVGLASCASANGSNEPPNSPAALVPQDQFAR